MLSLVNTALRSFYNPGVLRCTGTMLTRSRAVQTASNTTELDVFHDVNNCEFNINLNGEKAFLKYSLHGNRINLEHTEVPKVFEGKGVARVLAKAALEHCQKKKYQTQITCDYLQHFYRKNESLFKDIALNNKL